MTTALVYPMVFFRLAVGCTVKAHFGLGKTFSELIVTQKSLQKAMVSKLNYKEIATT